MTLDILLIGLNLFIGWSACLIFDIQWSSYPGENWGVITFHAQMQAFMVVRNKNTFIAFITFSDIYVCFTLFTLHAVVRRIPFVGDIPVPTW